MIASNTLNKIALIQDLDRLKGVLRMTSPIGMERRENSAEHSWQVCLLAILFEAEANEPVKLERVLKMLTIHDLVETKVGDTFHYAKDATPDLAEKEDAAAMEIFGRLENSLGAELLALWREFETANTPDSRFAAAVDRISAFLLNDKNNGGTWAQHKIPVKTILAKNAHISAGSDQLWEAAQEIVRRYQQRSHDGDE